MNCRRLLLATPCAWLLVASTLLAQGDPLALVPDDALGVAVIRNLSETSAAVSRLAQKMQIPAPDLLTMAKSMMGIENGLDEKGSICAALFADADDEDELAYLVVVPVSDYKAFIASFNPEKPDQAISAATVAGQDVLVANKGSFAVFTAADDRKLLERVLASPKSVVSILDPLKAWMATQQFAVVATPKGKTRLLHTLAGLIPEKPPADVGDDETIKSTFETLQVIRDLLGAADAQVTHLALAARIDDTAAARVGARVLFSSGGKLAAWAKNVSPSTEPILAGLPNIKYVLAYGGVTAHFSPEFMRLLERFTDMGFKQLGLTEEARKRVATLASRQREGTQRVAGVIGTVRTGEPVVANAVNIERVKDSAQYMKASRELFEALGAAAANKGTGERLYEWREADVGNLKALEITTNIAAVGKGEDNNVQATIMLRVLEVLFGSDGKMRSYIAAADDHTIVTAYTQEQLLKAVAHLRSGAAGLEGDAQIAKTNKLLMEGSQWAAYLSPQGLLATIDAVLQGFLPAGTNFRIPKFPDTEPIGMSAKLSPTALDAEIVIPDAVVGAIGQFVGLVQGMIQGGGVPLP